MSTDAPTTRAVTAWSEVFATLEHSLDRWLACAVEMPPQPDLPAPLPLRTFEERLERLQVYLDTAEQNAEQALAPHSTEIETLNQWLRTLNAARGNLAERTARAV